MWHITTNSAKNMSIQVMPAHIIPQMSCKHRRTTLLCGKISHKYILLSSAFRRFFTKKWCYVSIIGLLVKLVRSRLQKISRQLKYSKPYKGANILPSILLWRPIFFWHWNCFDWFVFLKMNREDFASKATICKL